MYVQFNFWQSVQGHRTHHVEYCRPERLPQMKDSCEVETNSRFAHVGIKMVEAGGVEPPSEKRYATEPTCLSQFRLFRRLSLERARNHAS